MFGGSRTELQTFELNKSCPKMIVIMFIFYLWLAHLVFPDFVSYTARIIALAHFHLKC